jgi:hypothetical protein
MKVDEITGGAPYGVTTIAGLDGKREVSENELAGARYQGRTIAEVAAKLHGWGMTSTRLIGHMIDPRRVRRAGEERGRESRRTGNRQHGAY